MKKEAKRKSLRVHMKENPQGRQCSVCGKPERKAARGVVACVCSKCVAAIIPGPQCTAERKEKEKAKAAEVREAGRRRPIIDCIKEVMIASGKPMHTKEIAQEMINGGIWGGKGSTPGSTVYAAIFKHPDFKRTAPSTFRLRKKRKKTSK